MNQRMKRLAELAEADERTILGLMSGTSGDGLDMALCRVSKNGLDTVTELLHFASLPFGEKLRSRIRALAFRPESRLGDIVSLNAELSNRWVEMIRSQLQKWDIAPTEVSLLASHGQTVLHQPGRGHEPDSTLQIVDGDRLSAGTGIVTVSDFRQKYIAAGYEGAPVAPLAELLLFTHPVESRYLLNLGGIGNVTVLPAGNSRMDIPAATDTGPANTLLDEAVRRLLPGFDFDPNGKYAREGKVSEPLLARFLSHPFFERALPTSTGQEEFHWEWIQREMVAAGGEYSARDLLATLVELTACSVSRALTHFTPSEGAVLYVSGGGWKNRFLMERLARQLPGMSIQSAGELGIDPDAKEALLFATLANETVAGEGWFNRKGERFVLGKLSFPFD